MRCRLLFVLAFLALPLTVAPVPLHAQTEFGVLGGVTFPDITGDDASDDLDRATGFLAGAFGRFQLGEIITFQPEVQYVRKGAEGETNIGDFNFKLGYIDVPLFLNFGLPGRGTTSFHALVGPTFSFEIDCDLDIDTDGGEVEADCDDEDGFDDERKTFLVGLTVGGGLDVPLGGLNLFLDGRYAIDLESFAEADEVDVKNQAYQIVAGLRFPLGMRMRTAPGR